MIHGIVGKKIGMTQIFAPDGRIIGITAIEAGPCMVTQVKTKGKDGYEAVQVGFGKARKVNSALAGHLGNLDKVRHLKEITADATDGVEVGSKLDASLFAKGDKVDITGISKGKGFAGGVKRYHFHGGPKTHGQSDRWRAPGSIGSTTTPGRVLKGQRMAGHMGSDQVTIKNLRVMEADPVRNLLLVRGAVPGPIGTIVLIHKAGKRK
ncbi:MAG: 50S ribosomal protein L3 [Chloroflexi bacterium]|nr:50S ribosomal protein L3 [Chloroflexota bacterium]